MEVARTDASFKGLYSNGKEKNGVIPEEEGGSERDILKVTDITACLQLDGKGPAEMEDLMVKRKRRELLEQTSLGRTEGQHSSQLGTLVTGKSKAWSSQ